MIQDHVSPRMLLLCACSALEARGDLPRLDSAIRKALDGGVTINELKDAFSQLYAYTGFPRSLNALGVYYMKSHLFGDIYASDQFTPAERELITVAALSAMNGVGMKQTKKLWMLATAS